MPKRIVKIDVDDAALKGWLEPREAPIRQQIEQAAEVISGTMAALAPLIVQAGEIAQRGLILLAQPKQATVWRDPAGVVHGSLDSEARDEALAATCADLTALAAQACQIAGPAAARLAEISEAVSGTMTDINKVMAPYKIGPTTSAAEIMREMSRAVPPWPPVTQ
jgi:hypothetical protein